MEYVLLYSPEVLDNRVRGRESSLFRSACYIIIKLNSFSDALIILFFKINEDL